MDLAQEYQAAQTGSVMIDAAAWGRLKFTGASRLDFLHRMSTNDVAKLQPGQGAATVFLTPIARMIDRTILYARENETLMITSRGNQARVFQWLRKYIFFNDDVQIKDVSAETAMISLYGAEANQTIRHISGEDLSSLPLHHWHEVSLAHRSVLIARADPIGGGGFHLIFERAAHTILWQALIDAGVIGISEAAYQVLRVEAGRPEFGRELGDEYIPLEANLWADVSFTKGCYTGQEIIARMESRQKLAKHLVGLRFEDEVLLPAGLFVDGHEVGTVTSMVHSPRLGWIGLGYVKTQGKDVPVVESRSGERAVGVQVVALPFNFD
jgi:aminomethyltransferase